MSKTHQNIELYKSLFRGRDDLYAVRWERDGKSGYMPAYDVDWSNYDKHKLQGGTFSNYKDKKLLPYNNSAINIHLDGKATHGIYPLLEDNTSYFIAVDFDKTNWDTSILKLYEVCKKHEIQSYIEKSRSGNGGHLWIFFEEAIPAIQSRKIMFELLRQANIISHFEKEPSFDRIFPNQDYHSGKGMGNLIALPLQGTSLHNGNSCFLNPDTMRPYENQWEFLQTVQKTSEESLKLLYKALFTENPQEILTSNLSPNSAVILEIRISNQIYIKRILFCQVV